MRGRGFSPIYFTCLANGGKMCLVKPLLITFFFLWTKAVVSLITFLWSDFYNQCLPFTPQTFLSLPLHARTPPNPWVWHKKVLLLLKKFSFQKLQTVKPVKTVSFLSLQKGHDNDRKETLFQSSVSCDKGGLVDGLTGVEVADTFDAGQFPAQAL